MDVFSTRTLSAVIIASIMGTITNAITMAITVSPDRLNLALELDRHLIAIALCMVLPLLDKIVSKGWFFILGFIWLALAGSIIAKFILGVWAPWEKVLKFNMMYSLASMITYEIIASRTSKKSSDNT